MKKAREFYERAGYKYALWQEKRYLEFRSLFDEMSWLQFSRYLPQDRNARILDAGCGGGGWSLRLAGLGYANLVLLDLAYSCVHGACAAFRRKDLPGSHLFFQGDLENNCLKPEVFDFIFCEREPLNYCVNGMEAAFRSLVDALRVGCRITVCVGTTLASKMALLREARYEEFFAMEESGIRMTNEGPQVHCTASSIKEMFKRNGVEVMEVSGRLTVTDGIPEERWEEIYKDASLKERLLQAELRYQNREEIASVCSHIFVAGRKSSK